MDPLLPLKSAQEDKKEFIKIQSTLADNGERESEDSSNADAAVSEHEKAPPNIRSLVAGGS